MTFFYIILHTFFSFENRNRAEIQVTLAIHWGYALISPGNGKICE